MASEGDNGMATALVIYKANAEVKMAVVFVAAVVALDTADNMANVVDSAAEKRREKEMANFSVAVIMTLGVAIVAHRSGRDNIAKRRVGKLIAAKISRRVTVGIKEVRSHKDDAADFVELFLANFGGMAEQGINIVYGLLANVGDEVKALLEAAHGERMTAGTHKIMANFISAILGYENAQESAVANAIQA